MLIDWRAQAEYHHRRHCCATCRHSQRVDGIYYCHYPSWTVQQDHPVQQNELRVDGWALCKEWRPDPMDCPKCHTTPDISWHMCKPVLLGDELPSAIAHLDQSELDTLMVENSCVRAQVQCKDCGASGPQYIAQSIEAAEDAACAAWEQLISGQE